MRLKNKTSASATLVGLMYISIFANICLPATGNNLFPKTEFESACAEKSGDDLRCKTIILEILKNEYLWGDATKSKEIGSKAWKDNKLQIRTEDLRDREGGFQIKQISGKLVPVMSLKRPEQPYELIITLNHELVHYASSQNLLTLITKKKKIGNCLTAFQLSQLKDETAAYHSEIDFWFKSPDWFKIKLGTFRFDSRLLQVKQITYREYYDLLKKMFSKNPLLISERYIELGKAPECAKAFI